MAIDSSLNIPEGTKEIDSFAYAENREITSVSFPSGLKKIGAHAFYNCRSLYGISLKDSDTDIGDGAFKNCERLREIEIVKTGGIKSLKALLFDAHRQVRVKLIYPDGEALLVFPYYIDNYEENTPARIVMHVSEGAGTVYRECIYSGDVDYRAYDELFKTGMYLDIYDSAAEIAMCRLKYPYKLGEQAGQMYSDFLSEHVREIFAKFLKENKIDSVRDLLELGIVDEAGVSFMADEARMSGRTEILAAVLEFAGSKKKGKRYEF